MRSGYLAGDQLQCRTSNDSITNPCVQDFQEITFPVRWEYDCLTDLSQRMKSLRCLVVDRIGKANKAEGASWIRCPLQECLQKSLAVVLRRRVFSRLGEERVDFVQDQHDERLRSRPNGMNSLRQHGFESRRFGVCRCLEDLSNFLVHSLRRGNMRHIEILGHGLARRHGALFRLPLYFPHAMEYSRCLSSSRSPTAVKREAFLHADESIFLRSIVVRLRKRLHEVHDLIHG
mmetsp:Transcript_51794/g.155433  ORF Transcript_51794/g.155433 Transcript_51794/m.155433 type:complete len:232 (+) Transcript_51794:762-1457(+)